jgi:predicted ester cyclase
VSEESERNKAIMASFWRDALSDIDAAVDGTFAERFAGIAPTGRRIRVSGIQIDRVRDGRVVESWNHSSDPGIVAQLRAEN